MPHDPTITPSVTVLVAEREGLSARDSWEKKLGMARLILNAAESARHQEITIIAAHTLEAVQEILRAKDRHVRGYLVNMAPGMETLSFRLEGIKTKTKVPNLLDAHDPSIKNSLNPIEVLRRLVK